MMARTIPNMAFLPPLQIRAQTSDLGAGRTSAFEKKRRMKMVSLGLFVRLEAKPGKEQEVAAFLSQALQMANQEETTRLWFSLRLGPSTFGVFDAFSDEHGRQTHLNGPIAKALMSNASNLFAVPPSIEKTEILGAKLPQVARNAA